MPRYYFNKKVCCECEREFSGVEIGFGLQDQPFIFLLQSNMTPNNFISKYIEILSEPNIEIKNQWSQIQDKDKFVNMIIGNLGKNLTVSFYEMNSIRQGDSGYLYSEVSLNLR